MNRKNHRKVPLKDISRRFACLAPEFAARIYETANTPFSLKMSMLLKAGLWGEIVSATVDPTDYLNADTFGRDYLCAELMSKYPSWDLGVDTAEVALVKFKESEYSCQIVNRTLRSVLRQPSIGLSTASVIATAARKIERVLRRDRDPDSSEFSWDEASEYFDWGPGASTSLRRMHGDAYYKFQAIALDASPNLRPLCEALRLWAPNWGPRINYVRGSKVVTVPKNAKTDRPIAIEPDLNMFFQKGVGGVIRRRLRRLGLLVDRPGDTAQQRNADLAREGSTTGRLATIDLSSASDTIAMSIVRELLPASWVAAIELCRSPQCVLPSGEILTLEKVSSMGNGFTFELETLLFWGLCSAIRELVDDTEHRVVVYGDDIIVGTKTASAVMQVFPIIGFTVNRKKSFLDGPFRESCGKHYFNGSDVTPLYVRRPIDTIDRIYWAANSVRRLSMTGVWGLYPRYKPVHQWLRNSLPRFWRTILGPDGSPDDACLHADFDEARPRVSRRNGSPWIDGYRYRLIRKRASGKDVDGIGRLRKSLWELEKQRIGEFGTDVMAPKNLTLCKAFATRWPSVGPWLD